MIDRDDSAAAFVEKLMRKAPELVDLFTADNDAQFDDAFDVLLDRAVTQLESQKKNFKDLNEEGLTGALGMALSMPGLTVRPEGHSNGHVDLIIEVEHCFPQRRKLAEAKIYDGPEKHVKGLEQLLTRYTTGKEGRGLLIVYFRKQDISGLVKKIREKMDTELPLKQVGATVDHSVKWWFLSTHGHLCGQNLQVAHIGCNLCIAVADEPAAEAV